ncbi:hypothetical protein [Streptomyces lunalinharesii]
MSTDGNGRGGSRMVVLDVDRDVCGDAYGVVDGGAFGRPHAGVHRVAHGRPGGAARGAASGGVEGGTVEELALEWRELVGAATAPGVGSGTAAGRLCGVLLGVPDATPYLGVLRLLADRITELSVAAGGFADAGLATFGPVFWRCLALAPADRLELLRRLLPADGPPPTARGGRASRPFARPPRVRVHPADGEAGRRAGAGWVDGPVAGRAGGVEACGPEGGPLRPGRFLDLVAELLKAAPERTQPVLCGWFDDVRPLLAAPAAPGPVTVAHAAQALLHTHRTRALDALVQTLIGVPHPRATELLDALAEDEPVALRRVAASWGSGPGRVGRAPSAAPRDGAAVTGRWSAGAAGCPMQQRPVDPSREAALAAWQS